MALGRAAHLAALPPRGPVFVSVPMDDWTAEVDDSYAAPRDRAHGRRAGRRRPGPGRSAWPSGSPARATRPWSRDRTSTASGGWDAAVALAERQRLPVYRLAGAGRGRIGFPEGHPQFQGILPPAIGPLAEALEGHDLVLVAGSSAFPYYPYIEGPLLPEGTSLADASPATPTRRRGRRWATRSSPTSG